MMRLYMQIRTFQSSYFSFSVALLWLSELEFNSLYITDLYKKKKKTRDTKVIGHIFKMFRHRARDETAEY